MLNSESIALIYPQITKKKKPGVVEGSQYTHSEATKRKGLRLVVNGMSVKEAAAEIGCGASTLNLWRKAAKDKLNNVMVEA